jgi:hypothetical protein
MIYPQVFPINFQCSNCFNSTEIEQYQDTSHNKYSEPLYIYHKCGTVQRLVHPHFERI